MKTVLVLLANGFEEIEAVTCIDVLRRADLAVTSACEGTKRIICGSHGIKIEADVSLNDFSVLPDALVLPGGTPGAENLAKSPDVIGLIKECHENKKIIAAICASPAMVLVPAGVLEGRRATCYPRFKNDFGTKTAYIDEAVVVDGNIITSQGAGTSFCFALKIVEALAGLQAAGEVGRRALAK